MSPEDATPEARTLADPDPESAVAFLRRGLGDDAVVTLFGRCRVDDEGRATADLGPGDRHLMLKPDGTALVHAGAGREPVAWLPPGGTHEARVDDGEVVVGGRRTASAASLSVRFATVAHAVAFPDPADGPTDVAGTEADLKRRVLSEPSVVEPGFRPLATERETPAGAVDVYGEDEAGRSVVLELKRRRAGLDAVGQLGRYVDALERDLHADARVRGVLVAPSVTERAAALLDERGLEFVAVSPPS